MDEGRGFVGKRQISTGIFVEIYRACLAMPPGRSPSMDILVTRLAAFITDCKIGFVLIAVKQMSGSDVAKESR